MKSLSRFRMIVTIGFCLFPWAASATLVVPENPADGKTHIFYDSQVQEGDRVYLPTPYTFFMRNEQGELERVSIPEGWVRIEGAKETRFFVSEKNGLKYHFTKNPAPDLFLIPIVRTEVKGKRYQESDDHGLALMGEGHDQVNPRVGDTVVMSKEDTIIRIERPQDKAGQIQAHYKKIPKGLEGQIVEIKPAAGGAFIHVEFRDPAEGSAEIVSFYVPANSFGQHLSTAADGSLLRVVYRDKTK